MKPSRIAHDISPMYAIHLINKKTEMINDILERFLPEEEGYFEDIKFHDKVRLELLLRLMKKDGADLDKYGNKVKAADIMKSVTSLPLQTCKNYCTDPKLSTKEHEEEILRLNTKLQALGMKIRL